MPRRSGCCSWHQCAADPRHRLDPGRLRENPAAEHVALDDRALRELVASARGRVSWANVAGLFAGVVAAFPDAHITIDDVFGQGDQVVVRVVVSGTQNGAILGIPASGRFVQWDGVDVYRLSDGKISNIWAGDDWTAILNDTGTFKAPWIP